MVKAVAQRVEIPAGGSAEATERLPRQCKPADLLLPESNGVGNFTFGRSFRCLCHLSERGEQEICLRGTTARSLRGRYGPQGDAES